MRTPRRWLVVVFCGVAVLGAVFGALFPTDAGKSLEVQGLSVGVGRTRVRDLHLNGNGLKVQIGEADLRYGFFDVLTSKTARVDPGPDTAKSVAEPFRFEGLRPLARRPVRCVLSEVDVDAELLLPEAGGATGELKADIGASLETAGDVNGVLEYQGEVRPADPSARKGAGLSARELLDVDPKRRALAGTVGEPDASALWKVFDEAAAEAKGSFGFALRKAIRLVGQ